MPSSVIASFKFNPDTEVLKIIFVSGREYLYFDVPAAVYEALKHAKSKGGYFNRHIRDKYSFNEQN